MTHPGSPRCSGTPGLSVGPLGLGVAPLGNLYTAVSEADAEATLSQAAECGIRWFDVAPLYGFGLAEQRLGHFLRQAAPADRVISTKVGRVLEPAPTAPTHEHFVAPLAYRPVFDYSRAGIERSYEESLHRLQLDRVQILLLHDIDRSHHSAHRLLVKQLLDESLPTLHRLKSEGRVDAIGLGINEWDIGYEILASADIDCVLLAGRYTLLDQTAESSGFLDACARRGVPVLAGGVLNGGFLAGGGIYDYHPATAALIQRRSELMTLCEAHRVELAAAALQFSASHPAIASLTIGARSAQEVDTLIGWSRVTIPPEFWDALRRSGFLSHDTPTPH